MYFLLFIQSKATFLWDKVAFFIGKREDWRDGYQLKLSNFIGKGGY